MVSKAFQIVVLSFLSALLAGSDFRNGAKAQSANAIIGLFNGAVQSAIAQTTLSEWRKIPPPEVDCISRALQSRGLDIGTLVRNGVTPTDARLIALRASCHAPPTQQASAPSLSSESKYKVDGRALGSRIEISALTSDRYACAPSDHYPDLMWCQRRTESPGIKSSSILAARDGTALYLNSYIEPASFDRGEIDAEIARLSSRFGEAARVIRIPTLANLPEAVIATWGQVELRPFDTTALQILAAGGRPAKGLYIDYLGDFVKSAKLGSPVYLPLWRLGVCLGT